MVMSALLSGSADSVFIHSAGSPNSSYLDILLEDKTLEVGISVAVSQYKSLSLNKFCQLKDKLFISDINLTHNGELDKMTSQQATTIGLLGIASFGGFFVQVKLFYFILNFQNKI